MSKKNPAPGQSISSFAKRGDVTSEAIANDARRSSGNPLLRGAVHAILAASALSIATPQRAEAACTDISTSLFCTGNESGGIDTSDFRLGLVVYNLSAQINPSQGTRGINFFRDDPPEQALSFYWDGSQSISTSFANSIHILNFAEPFLNGRAGDITATLAGGSIFTRGGAQYDSLYVESYGQESRTKILPTDGGNVTIDNRASIFNESFNGRGIFAHSWATYSGLGGNVHVTSNAPTISTQGDHGHGIFALSEGGYGANGDSGLDGSSGIPGGNGGNVLVEGSGNIYTGYFYAHGILAVSRGGIGGSGGDGWVANAGNGVFGGKAGNVTVDGSWNIYTSLEGSSGIFAESLGGEGGQGGTGYTFGNGGGGGGSGDGGVVRVTSRGNIDTGYGNYSYGIFAHSVGGFAGGGGGSYGVVGYGGSGESAGHGGNVFVTNFGAITTRGDESHGIYAQSVGGGGGSGGNSGGVVSVGGGGASGGNGGDVLVTNSGAISASGRVARGIFAQSVGGGGGDGGDSGGVAAIGGSGSGTSNGGTVTVINSGNISSSAHAIFAESIGGGGGNGGSSTGWFSVGGSGGSGGNSAIVTVENHGALSTTENNASAIFAHSVGGGGGNGGSSISAGLGASFAIGGNGATGGNGDNVTVSSDTGTIVTGADFSNGNFGDNSHGIFAQSVGGSGGNGGYAFSGSVSPGASLAISMGGSGAGGGVGKQVVVTSGGSIATHGNDANAIYAESLGGGGGSGGFAISVTGGAGLSGALAIGGTGAGGGAGDTVNVASTGTNLQTFGDRSSGIVAQSIGGGGGNGGFAVAGAFNLAPGVAGAFALGGNGGGGGAAKSVTVESSSNISTSGEQANGLFAQSVGGGGGNGGFSVAGSMSAGAAANAAFGGVGGGGGAGGIVEVGKTAFTSGTIHTRGDGSSGLFAQSVGGGGGNGGFAVAGSISAAPSANLSVGGNGGTARNSDAVTVHTGSNVITEGNDSHGVVAQSIGGGGGTGGFSVAGALTASGAVSAGIGGHGGGGGDAGVVTVENTAALIDTSGNHSYGLFAQSVGGGGGDGGFAVAGSVSEGPAANFAMGGDGGQAGIGRNVTVTSTSAITTHGDEAHGLFAQSVGGGGGTGGFSVAGSLSASGGTLGASIGGSGAGGGVAGQVIVTTTGADTGTISTGGNRSTGILAQSIGGGGGNGGFAIGGSITSGPTASLTVGGNGGTGSDSDIVRVVSGSSISTRGNDSHGIFAQSVGGGGGDGGFAVGGSISASGSINAALGGTGSGGGNAQEVRLTSSGNSITTVGSHSYGISAQSLGGGGGDGGFSVAAGISAGTTANLGVGGAGGGGGIGRIVVLNSSTNVSTQGNDSHGLFAQSVGGGGGSGGFSVVGGISNANAGASLGGKGSGGGSGGTVSLTTTAAFVMTQGDHAHGALAQSIGGGGGDGGFSVAGGISNSGGATLAMGGSGSGGGNGLGVTLSSLSAIETHGNDSHGLFAQSVGGGGGAGGFAVAGNLSVSGAASAGIGGSGAGGGSANTVMVTSNGSSIDTFGDRSYGIVAQSVGGGGGDGGFAVAGSVTQGVSANFAMGGSGSQAGIGRDVSVFDSSAITTRGDESHGLFAQSVGGGGGSGGFAVSGSMSASGGSLGASLGGSGSGGGKAGRVTVNTSTTDAAILTSGDRATGILAQSVGGGGGVGGFAISGNITNGPSASLGIGGNGGTGSDSDVVLVDSHSSVATLGNDAHGIFAQSVGGGGGDGGFAVAGSISATGNVNAALGGSGNGGGNAQNVTLISRGVITTTGTHSYGLIAQSLGGGGGDGGFSVTGGITNGATANLSLGGSGAGGGIGRDVLLLSSSLVSTQGDDAHGVFAQSVGGGGGSGGFAVTGGISRANAGASIGGSGAGGGDSGIVTLRNTAAMIATSGDHAYGVVAQSIGGGGGDGGFSVTGGISNSGSAAFALGGSGSGGGNSKAVTLESSSVVTTLGDDAHGLFAQSVGGGGGSGGFAVAGAISNNGAATAALGGSGASGGNADAVTLTNTGSAIATSGERSYGVVAQSVGGGGGDGGFSVSGSITKGPAANFSMGGSGSRGGTSSSVTLNSTSDVATQGDDSHGIFAQSIGGGGGSGGFSVSGSISADSGTVSASVGGSGGAGGESGTVSVGTMTAISGLVTTVGDRSYGILAQSIGGGGGDGGFSIAGGISKGDGAKFSLGGSGGTGSNSDVVSVQSAATIQTGGDESHGIFAQSLGGGGGSGGFSVAGSISTSGSSVNASIGGSGAGGGNGKAVSVASSGTSIGTAGDRAYGIVAQSIGGGGGDGGFSVAGSIDKSKTINFSLGGFGDVGGTADAVNVLSSTNITTTGAESHAIFAQSLGGGGGSGGFSIAGSLFASTTNAPSIDASVGGYGAGGGSAGAVTVGATNNFVTGVIDTSGDDAHGIFAQSLGGGGGNGGFSVAGGVNKSPAIRFSLGGSAGTGSSADAVNVFTAANITTRGDDSHGVFAQSLGGGGGNAGFAISGSATQDTTSVNASIGGKGGGGGRGGDVGVTTSGAITTFGDNSYGVFAQSIGGGGGNGGFAVAGSLTSPPSGAVTKKPANNIEFSMGGDGGSGDRGGDVDVLNSGVIDTSGLASHGILAQSVGGGGGRGGFAGSGTLSLLTAKSASKRATIATSLGGDGGNGNIGGDVDVTNTRDITTRGNDARGIYAYSLGGGGGIGGASYAIDVALGKVKDNNGLNLELAVGGSGGSGNTSGAISVDNEGKIVTLGDRGDAIFAQSVGGGGGDGGQSQAASFDFTHAIKPPPVNGADSWNVTASIGGNGGSANDGGHVAVTNTGDIETSGFYARGIVAQSVGGGGGSGANGIQGTGVDAIDTGTEILDLRDKDFLKNLFDLKAWSITVGGSGGASGNGKDVEVTNSGSIVTHGLDSFGIFAQSIGGGGGEAQNFAKGTGSGGTASSGINSKFALGGGGGASGDGGKITVTNANNIETFGDEAHGIFAQSVGGGGGVAGNVDRGFSSSNGPIPKLNIGVGFAVGQDGGGGGNGGDVIVTNTGSITTHGNGAFGILAQSIGGGGGAAGGLGNNGTFAAPVLGLQNFYGSAGGAGDAGIVTVNQTGNVIVSGGNAIGIFAQSTTANGVSKAVSITTNGSIDAFGVGSFGILAQSLGKKSADQLQSSDNINITINSGTIRGGAGAPPAGAVSVALTDNERGAAIDFRDGKNNSLINRGSVGDTTDLSRMAILGEVGNESISNFGTLAGNINLGGGVNALVNQANAKLISGAKIDLAAGNALTNNGDWSVGNVGVIAATSLNGNLKQNNGGRLLIDFDHATGAADRINVSGGAASLSGAVTLNELNSTAIKPGTQEAILISASGGVTASGLTLAVDASPITHYQLAPSHIDSATGKPTDLLLTAVTDFSGAQNGVALASNDAALGQYINQIQQAGSSAAMKTTIAHLLSLTDSAQLTSAYGQLSPQGYSRVALDGVGTSLRFSNALLSCKERDGDFHFVSEGQCGWFAATATNQHQSAATNVSGFSRDASTVAGGIQFALTSRWHLGFGASYTSGLSFADYTVRDMNAQTISSETSQGGVVVKGNFGATTLALSVSGGHGEFSSTRQALLSTQATSDQTVEHLATQFRIAHAFDLNRWYLRPMLDLGVQRQKRFAFEETGAGANNLHFATDQDTYVLAAPAVEMGYDVAMRGGMVRTYARIGVTQILSGSVITTSATLEGAPAGVAPFKTNEEMDKSLADVSLGVDLFSLQGIVVRLGYTGQFSSHSASHGGGIKVSVPF